jgi:hypothetical protein
VAGRPTRCKAGPETNAPQSAQEGGGVETRHAARNRALEFQWDANTSQRAANHSGLASLGFCPVEKGQANKNPKIVARHTSPRAKFFGDTLFT